MMVLEVAMEEEAEEMVVDVEVVGGVEDKM